MPILKQRIHYQWLPNELHAEAWGLDALSLQYLRRRGYSFQDTTTLR